MPSGPARPSTQQSGLKGQSLSDKVYGDILQAILDSDLPVGSRLPTEAHYCNLFGVSRTVVRDALARLKIDGVIASRQGQGSLLVHRPNRDVFDYAAVESIADMQTFFEFRQLLEGEAASLAAVRHSRDDLTKIKSAFEEISAALKRHEQGVDEDLKFHFAIAEAAHNKFLLFSMKSFEQNYRTGMLFARQLTSKYHETRGEIMQAEHLLVIKAIEARDPVLARQEVINHVKRTRDRVFLGHSSAKD